MNNLCVIPARGGSKRIPKKNIKSFRGCPIMMWSIKAAKESGKFRSIIVSTDDELIAKEAVKLGAEVPFMRPKEISDDYTDTKTVISYMIDELHKYDKSYNFVCCLYATAPFVMAEDLCNAIDLIEREPEKVVFPVTSYSYPIQRALRRDKEGNTKFVNGKFAGKRSQDLENMYHDAGQFYIANPNKWKDDSNILENSKSIIMPNWRVQDIDTEEDWKRAELLHRVLEEYDTNKGA